MCGIHFVLTQDTFAHNTDKFLKDAFLANMVRGRHSSGVFQINSKREITLQKKAVDAAKFIAEPAVDTILNAAPRSLATVGHVRHATQGSVTDDNAHPFLITRENGSKLVGVHNGSLRNWSGHNKNKVDVDSAWALQKIAEDGEDAFQYFDGPFAFVWYDTETPDHIWMTRNDDRPLHFMISRDRRTIIGASELGMLGWLAERNKIQGAEKVEERFFYLDPGKLYRFSLSKIGDLNFWDRQKYDPKTNITPVSSTTVNYSASLHPYQRNHSHQFAQDMLDDGYEDYYGNRGNGYSSHLGWLDHQQRQSRQDKMLQDVRDVLALQIIEDMTTDNLEGDDDEEPTGYVQQGSEFNNDGVTEAEIAVAVNEWIAKQGDKVSAVMKNNRWASLLFANPVFIGAPNDKPATAAEIQRVQRCAMYGKVGYFTGILYDEEESECLGQFLTYDKGKPVSTDATVRFCTKQYSTMKYINATEPVLMTIVGLTEPDPALGPLLVLSELRKDELAKVASRIDTLAKAN